MGRSGAGRWDGGAGAASPVSRDRVFPGEAKPMFDGAWPCRKSASRSGGG
jgi:hypothetical protein